jgi:hypothetical protein
LRERLFTTTGASLLRLTIYDFGDGIMRPAIRVRGREDITFAEIAETYEIRDAVAAARRALLSLGKTAIPEFFQATGDEDDAQWPPWKASVGGDDRNRHNAIPW